MIRPAVEFFDVSAFSPAAAPPELMTAILDVALKPAGRPSLLQFAAYTVPALEAASQLLQGSFWEETKPLVAPRNCS